jgi:hypothetical protein
LPRPAYQRNEYGGNLSGPIFIPRLYDGRDKSFFFAFEGFHLSQATNINSQQPTIAERAGDFSAFSTPIINPLTGKAFTGNMIPSSMFNSVDVQLQKIFFPLLTAAGTGVNTFEPVPFTSLVTRYSVRLDQR